MNELMEKYNIDPKKLPVHIAVIMDGNGRWAKQKGFATRIKGHENGVNALRELSTAAAEIGVKYLTVYAFSTENWNRPKLEVSALMRLLVNTLHAELETLQKNNIALNAIGRLENLPKDCHKNLREVIEKTKNNTRMTLTLALSYSSRSEMADALKRAGEDIKSGKLNIESIDDSTLGKYLYTHNLPDPDLLIRTSGEQRISNFLMWQLAYAELYFCPTLWPDYTKHDLYTAIAAFQQRERRFGKTSEQLKTQTTQ